MDFLDLNAQKDLLVVKNSLKLLYYRTEHIIKAELKDLKDVLHNHRESLERHTSLMNELTQTPTRNMNLIDDRPYTRSRGPVMDISYVQPRILERKREEYK